MDAENCLTLIGMPGCGKTTIGQLLANALNWKFVDTDYLIESLYARRLQDITDLLPREEFLNVECSVICALKANKCVIGTGGSVIYREKAMRHLKKLGSVIYLAASLETIKSRVAQNPLRGISFGPGQDLNSLYKERIPLYQQHKDLVIDTDIHGPDACAQEILRLL